MTTFLQRDDFAVTARVLGALFYYSPESHETAPLVQALLNDDWQAQWPLDAEALAPVAAMFFALLVGIPSGILLSRPAAKGFAEYVMQIFNVGNTLPPLAVLALAMVIIGIGDTPAIVALFLASLLPIVRNTYAGLCSVPASLIEAANGIGMTKWQRLRQVELPNAWPVMLSGIRIATAINVGTAPLAFLIGASSYGELIFPGIYLNDFPTLILGATATALFALILDTLLAWFGRRLSPHTV